MCSIIVIFIHQQLVVTQLMVVFSLFGWQAKVPSSRRLYKAT